MKIKVTRAPTITKAAIAAVLFTIVFLATNSSLPPCSDAVAALNAGGCLVRQSYLHTACGWLALASLITGVVLFILKQRKAPAKAGQAPSRPAWSGAPRPAGASRPAETTVPEVRTHGDSSGQFVPSAGQSGSLGHEQAPSFCTQCGTPSQGNFCQQCGAPVQNGSFPRISAVS